VTRVVCGQVWAAAQSRQRGLHIITQSSREAGLFLRPVFVSSPLASIPFLSKFHCSLFLVLYHLVNLSAIFFICISLPIFQKAKNKKKRNSHFAGTNYAYTEIALEPLCQISKSKFKIMNFTAHFQVESHSFSK
jgi:cytochrome bd-type quinol oxidase subunit 2